MDKKIIPNKILNLTGLAKSRTQSIQVKTLKSNPIFQPSLHSKNQLEAQLKAKLKAQFRRKCRNFNPTNPYYRSRIINKYLLKLLNPYRKILLYLPLPGEVDIKPIITQLKRRGKIVVVPAMVSPVQMKMVKFRLPTVKGRLTTEPATVNSFTGKVEVAVIPVIGIDKTGRRVGFGKGVYDRFFSQLSYKPSVIFIQLAPCFFNRVVTDWWDLEGEFYISFKIVKRRKNGRLSFNNGDFCRSGGIFYRLFDPNKTADRASRKGSGGN